MENLHANSELPSYFEKLALLGPPRFENANNRHPTETASELSLTTEIGTFAPKRERPRRWYRQGPRFIEPNGRRAVQKGIIVMPARNTSARTGAQDSLGMLNARDDWMRAILSDNDLSLTTRVVGCYFGTLVDMSPEQWPSIRRDQQRQIIKNMAAAIGLPTRVVANAFATLFREAYIYRLGRDYNIWLPKPADDATGYAS